MTRIKVARTIEAPVATVFDAITDIETLPERDPDVVRVDFVSEQRRGAGTRFRETRAGRGKEVVTELELTEVVENERARFVSDMGGTVWDTSFTFRELGEGSELVIDLDARPHTILARIMTPLIKGMVRRGMERHIDAVREHCERLPGSPEA